MSREPPVDARAPDSTEQLRAHIHDLEATLAAIRRGGVDAVVVGSGDSAQVYSLSSADRPYRTLVEEMGDGALVVSASGHVLYANQQMGQLVGRRRGDLVGAEVRDLVSRGDLARLGELLGAGPGETHRGELRLRRGKRAAVPVLVSVTGLDVDGVLVHCLVASDLTQRYQTEHRLAQASDALRSHAEELESANRRLAHAGAQFTAAFERAPVGMALVDFAGAVLRANEALAALVQAPAPALAGRQVDTLLVGRPAQELFAELVSGHRDHYRCEAQIVTAPGRERWVALSVARIRDDAGDFAGFHVEDIQERKEYEGKLQFLADHDPLTGLLNRRRLRDELERLLDLDRRYSTGGALVILDLDNFKYINDTLGHDTGDVLLRSLAQTISRRVRGSDVLTRLGGDEFAVLLAGVGRSGALVLVEDILAAIRTNEFSPTGHRLRTTASAGLALLDGSAETTADDLLANADLAMYAAKSRGGDGLVVYDPEGPVAALAQTKFVWLDKVRQALEEHEFVLVAQPIMRLSDGVIDGCELLLRLRDGDVLRTPDLFLGIAEQHGLAPQVDAEVVRLGLALAGRLGAGSAFRWEINISGASLEDADLLALIESEVARSGLSPGTVVFEITETAAISNVERARAFAAHVKELGCGFALDDFGAGYGGFYYLKHLPLDYIKIDGEFVRDLEGNSVNQIIVRSMVSAAHQLGKQTIAEYVTDAPTLALLSEYGVDHAQGFYVGWPDDAAVLAPHIARAAEPALGELSTLLDDLSAAPLQITSAARPGR